MSWGQSERGHSINLRCSDTDTARNIKPCTRSPRSMQSTHLITRADVALRHSGNELGGGTSLNLTCSGPTISEPVCCVPSRHFKDFSKTLGRGSGRNFNGH
ncbi:hypothetical protein PoB_005369300 [Plakobranchus ocellatus]|uniref:Uncharacterized protein n=1 Tax=Plakobranchus ocellatus TaxID=259542 RepID=A0AAV4C5L6_9GAST|nr:hypothetical protein PoB_005369300 [Plakobranchus ocellatus]